MSHLQRQGGVALAVVMWFIAGMSLLVAGIVGHARVDLQLAQVHVARAKVVAAGDGAIRLALADYSVGRGPELDAPKGDDLLPRRSYRLGEIPVQVRMHPANGLVNLNVANPGVLAGLLVIAGGLEPGEANVVVDNVVKWRQPTAGGRQRRLQARKLQAPEDLLQIEGVSRSVLDGIRDYVVAADWASGEIDWSAVPEPVLELMQQVDPGRMDAVLRRRDKRREVLAEGPGSGGKRVSPSGVYRVDALVQYGDNTWLRRRWVSLGSGDGAFSLPWRVLRSEPPRIMNESQG